MTALILDDQPHVIAGLMLGIRWEMCGVKRILKATSVQEARARLQSTQVDIVLADIEMPGETGLELIEWMREENYTAECIVLTAHANFAYAQRALRLNSIDYILQPAPYSVIENAIVKALQRIELRREEKRFSSYGHLLWSKHKQLLQIVIADWFGGRYVDTDTLCKDLNQLGLGVGEQTEFLCAVFRFENQSGNNQVLLESVLADTLTFPDVQSLIIGESATQFQGVFFSGTVTDWGLDRVGKSLRGLPEKMQNDCGLKLLFTASDAGVNLSGVADEMDALMEKLPAMPHAEEQAVPGSAQDAAANLSSILILCEQYRKKATGLYQQEPMDTASFQVLYFELLQSLAALLQRNNLSLHTLFGDDIGKLMNAYRNPGDLRECLDHAISSLKSSSIFPQNDQEQLGTVVQYIHQNIEKDLKRAEIAKAVYLSPSYLSRLFRTKMNITLKDFIITEKMKLAHSLLHNTSLSVSAVANKVGYTNFSYFSQTYKRIWDVTPSKGRGAPEE